jgi:hypothetical protein
MAVCAVQHVRRMRGGAQSHLMRCSDGNFYVVKFQNNPQGVRILANELIGSRLAEIIGLPMPATEIVEVDPWLIEHTPELHVQFAQSTEPCKEGLQFGSRYVIDPMEELAWDYMPVEMLHRVSNLETFSGMLAFDKWTGNADGRQATFWRKARARLYKVTYIDQGYCFNAGEWTFPNYPLHGVYARNEVYANVISWKSFEPWLREIENLKSETIWQVLESVPTEWYGDWSALKNLGTKLIERQNSVRTLIVEFGESARRPFPNWNAFSQDQSSGAA